MLLMKCRSFLHLIRTIKSLERGVNMTLVIAIRRFIDNFIKSKDLQRSSNYEDTLEYAVDELYSLCTTDEERELVKAVVRLEDH